MQRHTTTIWIDGEEVTAEVHYTHQLAEDEQGHLFVPEHIDIQFVKIYPPAWFEKKLVAEIEMANEILK